MIKCPDCGRLMEIVLKKNDNSMIQFECRNCLSWFELKRYKMTDEEIREIARE